jgi:hypothetical protein
MAQNLWLKPMVDGAMKLEVIRPFIEQKKQIQYYPQLNSQSSHAKGKSIQTAQKLGTVGMT